MLEDMYTAVNDLETVSLRFGRTQDISKEPLTLEGTRSRIIATINLTDTHYKLLPRPLREGRLISLIPCLFTQGINEAQTLANTLGGTALQDEINAASVETLQKYCTAFKSFCQNSPTVDSLTDPKLRVSLPPFPFSLFH